MISGNCLCGTVSFEFESKPTNVSICHCTICRRTTGSAFGAYVKVADADLTLSGGADRLETYSVTDKLGTRFCRVCGSTVFARHADYPGFTYISLGTIDDEAGIRPMYHEFVGSKAAWFDIRDSLPQFREWSNFD